MRKTLVLVLGLLVFIVLAWLVLSRVSSPQAPEESTTQPAVEEAVDEAKNPIEGEIPDVNPAAKTNPFGGAYKNPFE